MEKIAVLTSGGDAPGMNACIRAVVRTALSFNMDIYGVERGYAGLIKGEISRLGTRSVSDMIHKGGTFLKTARCPEFLDKEVQHLAVEQLAAYGIEGLVVIGGDGTFRGAKALIDNFGVKVVGIPGTI
ncbi:MAG: 6-phosphofructokinase, partial [Clostridia bacterium]|nr:6-phosphofructokinase [Clostridia bacterium]